MNTHTRQQICGQLLFQEDRLILKYSLIAFNSAENWKNQLMTSSSDNEGETKGSVNRRKVGLG